MNLFLQFSVFTMWIIIFILASMVILLYGRIEASSTKAKKLFRNESGFPTGTFYPKKDYMDINGNTLSLSNNTDTLLLFTQYSCDVCKRVYPILSNVNNKYPDKQIILFMLATKHESQSIMTKFNLEKFPVVLIKNEELHLLGISGFPFAYLLSPNNVVTNKGVINSMEHFDILFSDLDRKMAKAN